jgi:hypothetical protein
MLDRIPNKSDFRSLQPFGEYTLALALLCVSAIAQPRGLHQPMAGSQPSNSPDALKRFIQARVRQIDPNIDETTKYSYAFVDLNGDGRDEAIVHLTGRSWCGTGGCITYILTPYAMDYKFVARVPATRTPIRVLDKVRNGWHSVTVMTRGDLNRLYEGELRYNGQKYPLGDRPPSERLPGRVVISEAQEERPLFP